MTWSARNKWQNEAHAQTQIHLYVGENNNRANALLYTRNEMKEQKDKQAQVKNNNLTIEM